MSESARRMRANKVLAGSTCAGCVRPIELGAEAAVCTACETPQHAACWDGAGGCASSSCVNAPLAQLAPSAVGARAPAALPPGRIACPHCDHIFSQVRGICPKCRRAPTATGEYDGPKSTAPGATAALVYGILALFICGIIFGLLAIGKAREAKRAIERDPRYGGGGMATAGMVLGSIAIVLNALWILLTIASR